MEKKKNLDNESETHYLTDKIKYEIRTGTQLLFETLKRNPKKAYEAALKLQQYLK